MHFVLLVQSKVVPDTDIYIDGWQIHLRHRTIPILSSIS